MGDYPLFHIEDGGRLEEIGQVSLEYGSVALLRCAICGGKMDASDYDRIAHVADGKLVDYKGKSISLSPSS